MSIAKYEVFLKVVESGSLTRAAETMGLTQSGVSHAITSLEAEFGLSLLTRNRSGVKLTVNGERILKHIREILKWNEELKQEVAAIHGIEVGTVRIGTFTSVSVHWLPGIIKSFQNDHPAIQIHLMEGDYHEIESWVANGEIDFGFLSLPTLDVFDIIPLAQDRMLCILPKGHSLSGQTVIHYSQLENESFIMPKAGSDYDVRRVLEKRLMRPAIAFEAADDYAIIAMVENGLGISILPEMLLHGRDHNISALELEDNCYRSLGIATGSYISPAARKFIAYVTAWLEEWKKKARPMAGPSAANV